MGKKAQPSRPAAKRGRVGLVIISIIVLILVLAFTMYKLFRVRHITVAGCETLSEEHVISLSNIEYDQHVFKVDTQTVMDSIDEDPLIKPISIDIVYPDTVAIMIEERKPAACIVKEGTTIVIDDDCFVLEVNMQTEEYTLPRVTGVQLENLQIGQQLGAQDAFQLGVLSRVLTETEGIDLGLVGIDVMHTADIKLMTQDGLTIEIGDDTQLPQKIQLILSSWKELGTRGENGAILDVASVNTAYYSRN